MKNHNPANERIKRKYFAFLKEAKRHSEPTVDAAAKALSRFEAYTQVSRFQGISLRAGHCLQKASCRAEGAAVRGETEQGDPACDPYPTQTVLSVAGVATGLQVACSVCRCRVFQSVRQGHPHRHRKTATKSSDPGTDQARHQYDAGRYRDRAPESRPGGIHAADRGAGQRHCLAEAEACRSDCRLRQPGCPGG